MMLPLFGMRRGVSVPAQVNYLRCDVVIVDVVRKRPFLVEQIDLTSGALRGKYLANPGTNLHFMNSICSLCMFFLVISDL